MTIDQTNDAAGLEIHRIQTLYEAPEWVKSAGTAAKGVTDVDTLPRNNFGDPVQRLYPCHTKAATWCSAALFAEQREQHGDDANNIAHRLMQAAGYWGIKPDVNTLWDKVAAASLRQPTPDNSYALVWTDANNNTERRYPLRNVGEVKRAATWFGENCQQFEFNDAHKIATRILEKAAEYDTPCDNTELLQQYAGYGFSSPRDVAAQLTARAHLVKKAEMRQELLELASNVVTANIHPTDSATMLKLASTIDAVDRHHKLTQYYTESGGLIPPAQLVFAVSEKQASHFSENHVVTITGKIYEKSALQNISAVDLRNWLGDDIADECGGVLVDHEKLAGIIPTLPRADAVAFDRMANQLRIPAVGNTKTAADSRGHADLQALASKYQPGALSQHSPESALASGRQ